MAWTMIFGVNGAGKSTIAQEIKKLMKGVETISGTHVLLASLGEGVPLGTEAQIPFESYQQLERTDMRDLEHAYTTLFPQVLGEYKVSHKDVILFYHLCVVKKDAESGEVVYDNSFVRDWFCDLFDQFIFLEVSGAAIQKRCTADRVNKTRLRLELSLEQIEVQIDKSKEEWEKLVEIQKLLRKNSCYVIPQ